MTPGQRILVWWDGAVRTSVTWNHAKHYRCVVAHRDKFSRVVIADGDRGIVWVPDVPGAERDAFIVAATLR